MACANKSQNDREQEKWQTCDVKNERKSKKKREPKGKKTNRLFFTSFAFSIIFLSIVTPVSRLLGLLSIASVYKYMCVCEFFIIIIFSHALKSISHTAWISMLSAREQEKPNDRTLRQKCQKNKTTHNSQPHRSTVQQTYIYIEIYISNYFITMVAILFWWAMKRGSENGDELRKRGREKALRAQKCSFLEIK